MQPRCWCVGTDGLWAVTSRQTAAPPTWLSAPAADGACTTRPAARRCRARAWISGDTVLAASPHTQEREGLQLNEWCSQRCVYGGVHTNTW
jgi:hypothetical protein